MGRMRVGLGGVVTIRASKQGSKQACKLAGKQARHMVHVHALQQTNKQAKQQAGSMLVKTMQQASTKLSCKQASKLNIG